MKMRIGVVAMFLVFVTVPFSLARQGGAHFSSAKLDQATGNQREAFALCMTTTEAARKTGRQMGSNSYWNAKHGIYDLSAVYRNLPQLQPALTDMAAAHQRFLKVLSQDQDAALGPDLGRVERLQTALNLEMSQLNEQLMAVRPNKFQISTSVYEIGKTIDKWHSEHKKIAKKIGISKP